MILSRVGRWLCLALALILVLSGRMASGQDAPTGRVTVSDVAAASLKQEVESAAMAGHNAWMLTSAALVLLMTAPGLALFYGGLVRKKNVLGVMMQCFFLMGLNSIIWALWGYSLVFGGDPTSKNFNPWIGNGNIVGMQGFERT